MQNCYQTEPDIVSTIDRKTFKIEPMHVGYDDSRPVLKPFGHQQKAIERYKDEIALFFEMGCGKSFTTLQIAQEKYLNGEIDGLLVVAPNDVHRQWFDELVFGVELNDDGVLWQEMSIEQQKAYKSMKKDLLAEFGEHTATASNKLVASLRLQQISSGF